MEEAAQEALPQRSRRRRREAHRTEQEHDLSVAPVPAEHETLEETGVLEEEIGRLVLEETWSDRQLITSSSGYLNVAIQGGRFSTHNNTGDSKGGIGYVKARELQADYADEQEFSARCTHFVSIPVDNISLLHRVATVQDDIILAEPALRPGLIDRRSLHLTLAALVVEPDALPRLRDAFEEHVPTLVAKNLQGAPSLTFSGLGHFNDRVLFLRPAITEALRNIVCLAEEIKPMLERVPGVLVEPAPFRPHVTILKTSKLPPGAQHRFRHGIDKTLYARHKDLQSGSQRIAVLELNAMRTDPATGRFITVTCAAISRAAHASKTESPPHFSADTSNSSHGAMRIPAGARSGASRKDLADAHALVGGGREAPGGGEVRRYPQESLRHGDNESAVDGCEGIAVGGCGRSRRRGRLQQKYMPPTGE